MSCKQWRCDSIKGAHPIAYTVNCLLFLYWTIAALNPKLPELKGFCLVALFLPLLNSHHNLFSSCSVHTATISSHNNLFCSCSVHTDTELTPHCFVVAVYTQILSSTCCTEHETTGFTSCSVVALNPIPLSSQLLFSCTEPKTNDTASVVYVQYLHWTKNWT